MNLHPNGKPCGKNHYFNIPDRIVHDITLTGERGLLLCEDMIDFPDSPHALAAQRAFGEIEDTTYGTTVAPV